MYYIIRKSIKQVAQWPGLKRLINANGRWFESILACEVFNRIRVANRNNAGGANAVSTGAISTSVSTLHCPCR